MFELQEKVISASSKYWSTELISDSYKYIKVDFDYLVRHNPLKEYRIIHIIEESDEQ